MINRQAQTYEVFDAIRKEMDYQDAKFGVDKQQSLPGYLVIMENELIEAKHGWTKNLSDRHSALHEIVQLAATAIRCLEQYGVTGSAIATNDIPTKE